MEHTVCSKTNTKRLTAKEILVEIRDDDDVYTRNGYKDREDYLKNLADDRGIELFVVTMIADMLGPSEDFDGLVTELEDMDFSGALDAFRE
jgi:hypothetical protein